MINETKYYKMNIPSKNNKVNLMQNCRKSESDFIKKELNVFCDLALDYLEKRDQIGIGNASVIKETKQERKRNNERNNGTSFNSSRNKTSGSS
jgi:hypothetical protein